MLEQLEKRKAELANTLAQTWATRGQSAKQVEDSDALIKCIEHRLDEIGRMITAEEEAKKKAEEEAKKQTATDKGKPEIV